MPVESRWLVPGKIIHTDLVGDLTIDDIRAGSKGVIALLDESDHRMVHIIGNESRMGSMPKSLNLGKRWLELSAGIMKQKAIKSG